MLGKLFGIIIGTSLSGFGGAIIGAAIGHLADRRKKKNSIKAKQLSNEMYDRTAKMIALTALLARMPEGNDDGIIAYIIKTFDLNIADTEHLRYAITNMRKESQPLEQTILHLKQIFQKNTALLNEIYALGYNYALNNITDAKVEYFAKIKKGL